MAIDCVDAFNNENTLIRLLQANTEYTGTLSNQFQGAFFKFEMTENETLFFTLRLNPHTTQPINVQFTLYRKEGETTFTNLGTSQNDDFYNSFDYAATPAEYYVCITTDWGIDYTLEADFTDYPFVLIADCDAYAGEYIPPVVFAPNESICDSTVFYTIVEGTLPKGLSFSPDGVIYGIPEEQDCEPLSDEETPPSFTWWEDDGEEAEDRTSTGLDHRIVVRAQLLEAEETYHDREFFICIRNNWDQDRDHYIGLKENWEKDKFELIVPEGSDDTPQPGTGLQTLGQVDPPCEEWEEESDLNELPTLQEIQELTKQVVINEEFTGLIEINNGICEVCPVEEVDTAVFEIQSISLDGYCDPCPEPTVVEGLQPIPESLCDVEVEITQIASEQYYQLGIPDLCFPEIISDMYNTKVCGGRPVCPLTVELYPNIEPDNTLSSLCPPCGE